MIPFDPSWHRSRIAFARSVGLSDSGEWDGSGTNRRGEYILRDCHFLPLFNQISLGLRALPPTELLFAKRAQRSVAHKQIEWEPDQCVNQPEDGEQHSFTAGIL